jgi:hypothetical protein
VDKIQLQLLHLHSLAILLNLALPPRKLHHQNPLLLPHLLIRPILRLMLPIIVPVLHRPIPGIDIITIPIGIPTILGLVTSMTILGTALFATKVHHDIIIGKTLRILTHTEILPDMTGRGYVRDKIN